jgi:hypothetical protein
MRLRVPTLGALLFAILFAPPLASQGDTEPPAMPLRRLHAASDAAVSGLRGRGYFTRICAENSTGGFDIDRSGCGPFFQTMTNGFVAMWFREGNWAWGVPRSDWERAVAQVPALANAIGGGWTVSASHQRGFDDVGPADGALGLHHAGVTSVNDRSCRDHSSAFATGVTLLAGSDCPVTWGSAGWEGARPVPAEVYRARYLADPQGFRFDPWSVSDAELDAAGVARETPIGTFQTYGYTTDFSQEILCGTATLRNWAHVLPPASPATPGGCPAADARRRPGWPLGIEVRFDAFTFDLPLLENVAFYQVTFTNRSRQVYGVGLDFDSLYISLQHGWFGNSNITQSLIHHVPAMGAVFANTLPQQLCDPARQVSDITCARWGTNHGWAQGAGVLLILKSPTGDLRNRLFSQPGSPFYNPTHALAGDTFTFNHAHLCGFRLCGSSTWSVDPAGNPDAEQRAFGMLSSTEANVLGARTAALLTSNQYWHTFRNENWNSSNTYARWAGPGTPGGFNRWAPAMTGTTWDWNKDGVQDTIAADNCFVNGCTELFGDTLPSGTYNAYSSVHATVGVGPLRLPADSTVGFVIAITSAQANDSAGFLASVEAAITHYLDFYPTPRPAPVCRIVGASRGSAADTARVTLTWDDTCFPGRWTDAFLARTYSAVLAASGASPLGRLRQLNPWLDDSLAWTMQNNVGAVHLYKSCDDGATWTATVACTADTATSGSLAPLGYRPYATFFGPGSLRASFVDSGVRPGHNYVYALVTETRGAQFTVIDGDSVAVVGSDTVCVLRCRTRVFRGAPVLVTPLGVGGPAPNVARVYLPVSRQAGARPASVMAVDSAGYLTSDRVGVTITADSVPAGRYVVAFGDSARATQTEYRTGTTLDSVRTRVVLRVATATGDSLVISGTNTGGFTTSGGSGNVSVTTPVPGTSITTRTHSWASPSSNPLTMVVARLPGPAPADALLVSSTLGGATATPAAFHANADYPGFDLALNLGLNRVFAGVTVLDPAGRPLAAAPTPSLTWLPTREGFLSLSPNVVDVAVGTYEITWGAPPFGAGEPFDIRTATAAAATASLAARPAITTGSVNDTVALAIYGRLQRVTTVDSLVAVRLPFRVRNVTFGHDVEVAMRRRMARTILIGAGADTLRVPVPDDVWVPGDTLFFFERSASLANSPRILTRWGRVLGCESATDPRITCNPVAASSPGATGYVPVAPGMVHQVRFHTVVTPESRLTFDVHPPLAGASLTAQPDAIRAALAAVRVVPNPYVLTTSYAGGGLLFTHLPPRGVLRIYTVSGQFVQQIRWNETDLRGDGDVIWDLRTREGKAVQGGLYLYVLTALDAADRPIGVRRDRFVIIR